MNRKLIPDTVMHIEKAIYDCQTSALILLDQFSDH